MITQYKMSFLEDKENVIYIKYRSEKIKYLLINDTEFK